MFFYGLSGPLYRTESLRAMIGQSALEGHWLTPTLYGEPFLTKPPGCYAAIGAASIPFGRVTEISARLPSAIAATLTVLCVFGFLRKPLGPQRAFIAATLLPASLLWLDKVPSAEIDILQLAWVTLSLFCFFRATQAMDAARTAQESRATPLVAAESRPRSTALQSRASAQLWWLAALLCVAGGFLTKWTAPAFFYLAVGSFLIWRRRWMWLFSREHLIAVVVAISLCAAWAMLVANEVGWSTLRDTVMQEGAQRFAPKSRGKPYPWGESLAFPAIVIGAFLPWSIPALTSLRSSFGRTASKASAPPSISEPPALAGGASRNPDAAGTLRLPPPANAGGSLDAGGSPLHAGTAHRITQLLHCWAWPNLLFWSLPAQHNVRYVLPILPAISLLGVLTLHRWLAARHRNSRILPAIFIGVLIAWIGVKIVFVEAVVPNRTANRNARETGSQLAGLVPEGEVLYLCRLKDEGVLFYYGRPALRLAVNELPTHSAYLILLDAEWREGPYRERCVHLAELKDQQQATIHLVRFEVDREWQPRPIPPMSSPSAP